MKNTLRVLCLEDDEEDFDIINYTLTTHGLPFVTHRVHTKEEFLHALSTYKPDVILSDHALPQFSSTEALEICKAKSISVPFILVTGAVSDEFAVTCLKKGADDYVLKSSMTKLPSVIESTLRQKETERAKLKAATELARRNKELSKINKELDSFVYSVSHNLRAPLRSVLGLLNLSKNEKDPVLLEKYHAMMEKSILKLDDSLKDILEYSRNARQEIKIQKVSLKKIIDENFERMQFMPGFEDLIKEVLINEDQPLYSDEYRLSVIFNNLISNTIKYLDKSKSNSFIKISGMINNDTAFIELQDNGIGIEKNALPKIFDMFFRGTEKREGAGLGLYIVKEAVELLHGTIQVHSNPGEGTYFRLEIPNQLKTAGSGDVSMNRHLVDRGNDKGA